MARYFKIIEIDCDSFVAATGEDLDCEQLAVSTNAGVFVAVNDYSNDEITVSLESFDPEEGG